MRIDSHQHFWSYDSKRHGWMNDAMALLKQDYFPADLAPLLKSADMQGCVAVQADQSEAENRFLMDLAFHDAMIQGVVGWVDFRAANIQERLDFYADSSIMKGFRHVVQDEPDLHFLLGKDFMRGISALEKTRFTYDLLIFEKHLAVTIEFLKHFPNQAFVIDHLAKPNINEQSFRVWEKQIAQVAAFDNVYCKLSGMVTEADWLHWKPSDLHRYMDVIVHHFGTDRIMYGSDWPVCLLAATYQQQYAVVDDYFAAFSAVEKQQIFGLNAMKFYQL